MGQLEPGPGESVLELVRIFEPARRDFAICRVLLQGKVGGEHDGRVRHGRIVRIRHQVRCRPVCGNPLDCASWALGLHPVEGVEVLQEIMGPGRRGDRPRAFQAAGDGVGAMAVPKTVTPAERLRLDGVRLWFDTHVLGRISRAVGLAEGMAAGDQRSRLFVVHRHAAERLAYGVGGRQRIRVAARTLGIDVDEAHLGGAQGRIQHAILVAAVGSQPLALGTPVHVFRLPGVDTAAGEAQGLEAHRVHGHGAGEDQQVGPGDLAAVLLLDRPEQAVRLVQVCVVGPAVERREALQAAVGPAPAVNGPVGARAVPGHSNEERPVVAEVRRPPVLGRRHQRCEIGLHRIQVEAFERLGVIEVLPKRTRCSGVPGAADRGPIGSATSIRCPVRCSGQPRDRPAGPAEFRSSARR